MYVNYTYLIPQVYACVQIFDVLWSKANSLLVFLWIAAWAMKQMGSPFIQLAPYGPYQLNVPNEENGKLSKLPLWDT